MSAPTREWSRLLPGLILLLAVIPRLASVSFNVWPHGDVLLDAAVADALVQRGELKVPLVDIRFYPTNRFGFGYPPDQHPPLWPLLGSIIALFWRDSYEALKLVSLISGVFLIAAVYRCGRDLFGRGPGLLASALCAVSYLLIDFSGNGSLWSLLALIYVVFVWRAACFPLTDARNGLLLGLLMGAGYLTNYPAVILPLSFIALITLGGSRLLGRGTSARATEAPSSASPLSRSPTPPLPHSPAHRFVMLLPLLTALVLVLPWLAFNTATFGNPIWSQPLERQLGGEDKGVEAVVQNGEAVKRHLAVSDPFSERLRATAKNVYGNVGFVLRQSFVLAPFLAGFALAGLAVLLIRAGRAGRPRELALLLVTIAHTGLIVLWPTTKFRYLVPLFPLIALIGSWVIWQIKPPDLRNLLVTITLGFAALTSIWTFASIPSHTYYYNGGVVTDNFGGQGEIAYIEEVRGLEQAALVIRANGPGTVLGPHPLYALAREPLVINSAAYSREVVEHLVRRYDIRYIVADPTRLPFYTGFFDGRVLWRDAKLVVYELAK